MSNNTIIHVGSPSTREQVPVTRGDTTLYFVRYDDATTYTVIDEYGDETGHTWSGDIDGIADFIALSFMFDQMDGAA